VKDLKIKKARTDTTDNNQSNSYNSYSRSLKVGPEFISEIQLAKDYVKGNSTITETFLINWDSSVELRRLEIIHNLFALKDYEAISGSFGPQLVSIFYLALSLKL
jgi:hypothetical protein